MVLPKQEITIPFSGGINSKIAEYLLPTGNFLTMENMVQDKTGELSKRKGNTALGTTITGTTDTITSAKQLLRYKDELLLADGKNLYSYNSVSDTWSNRGTYYPMQSSTEKIMGGAYRQRYESDTMLSNNIYAHTYLVLEGLTSLNVKYHLTTQSAATSTILQPDYELTDLSTSMWSKSAVLDRWGLIFGASNSNNSYITCYKVDMQDDGYVDGYAYFATDAVSAAGSRYFAVCEVDTTKCLFAYQTSGSKISIGYCDENGMIDPYELNVNKEPWAITQDGNGYTYLFTRSNSGTTLSVSVLQDSGTTLALVGSVDIETTSEKIFAITAASLTNTSVQVFYEEYSGSVARHDNQKVRTAVVDNTATVTTTAADFVRGVGLAFGAFNYNNDIFVGLVHEQASSEITQNTIFLANQNGDVVARSLVGRARGVNTTFYENFIPKVVNSENNCWKTIQRAQGEDMPSLYPSVATASYILTFVTFDFDKHGNYVEQNEELLIAAGQLYTYDGKDISESGFHLYPQRIDVSESILGGALTDGTYSYKCAYVYYDNAGKRHISGTSQGKSITLSGGGSAQGVSIAVPTLRLTQKGDSNTKVITELYRTTNGGSIYYNVSSTTNDPTVDAYYFTDTVSDTEAIAAAAIYTEGGVLDNVAPPSSFKLLSYQNRILLLSGNDFIYYSKDNQEGDGIAFSDGLRIIVDHAGGPIKDIEILDTQVIIAKKEKLLHLAGNPANDAGQNENWAQADLNSDIGLKDNCRLAYTADGIIVPSNKGIWLLDRALNTTYYGAPVDGYNDQTFISTTSLRSDNKTFLIMEDNSCMLVYDTYHKNWSAYTNYSAVDGVEWNNSFVHVTSAGQVYKSNNLYTDNGTSITQRLITAWFNVAGLIGYQKLTDIYLLGTFKSPSTLNTVVHYDGYSESINKSITSDPGPFLIRIRPAVMKCRSFKLEIYDSNQSGTEQSFTLNGIKIRFGVKRKLPVSADYIIGQGV